VLAPQAADVAHPAFQPRFAETEYVADEGCLRATRRPRAADERQVWAAHVLAVQEGTPLAIQYETDRARFLGRGRSVRSAVSVLDGRPLSNTVGAVLDPIFSLRCRLRIAPGETASAVFSTAAAESREEILELADALNQASVFERAATLSWTQAQVQLHHLGIDADEAHLFQRLANRIVYSDPTLRPPVSQLARNRRGVSGLWPHGISGDLPIVVARIDGPDGLDVVRQLLRAHEYWRMKLVDADLVIVNEGAISYAQDFQGALEAPLSVTGARPGQPVRAGSRIARGARCGPYPARRSPVRERSAAAAWRPADRAPDSCGKASRTRSAAQDRPGEGIAARALAAGTVRPCTSADPTVARPSRARVVQRPGGLRR